MLSGGGLPEGDCGARAKSIPVLVDPKTADFARYKGAIKVCPNLGELATAVGGEVREVNALLDAAEGMVREFDLEFLTATLGEKGIALLRPGNRMLALAVARQVFDVSGAGDTVIAVLDAGCGGTEAGDGCTAGEYGGGDRGRQGGHCASREA